MTTILTLLFRAALTPSSAELIPALPITLKPAHPKKFVENAALAFLIDGFPTGSKKTAGAVPVSFLYLKAANLNSSNGSAPL